MLVNSYYVSRGMGVRKVSNSKNDLSGLWQWCHSIGHIRFPIRLPLQPCLYLTPSGILSFISQTSNTSVSVVIYHPGASKPPYQSAHNIFEVLSFTESKDTIGAKFKKGSRDPDHAPFMGCLSSIRHIDTFYLCAKFDDSSLSRSRHINEGPKI